MPTDTKPKRKPKSKAETGAATRFFTDLTRADVAWAGGKG